VFDMQPGQNTATGIGGERVVIHFSGQVPEFNVEASPADPSLASSHERLGEMALLLGRRDATIVELVARVTALESTVAYMEGSNGAGPPEAQPGRQSVEAIDSGSADADADEVAKPGLDLSPNENLLPPHQKYERIILYLLNCPDLTLKHADAGGFLRKELGYEPGVAWNNARAILIQQGILSLVKVSPEARRSTEVNLNVGALLEAADKPYVTPRVLEALRAGNTAAENGRVIANSAQSPPAPANAESNGQVHHLSARTRKAMEQEPDPIPGYKTDGKKPHTREGRPFLVHRRSPGGIKSGR
jgi:hypothetical protein